MKLLFENFAVALDICRAIGLLLTVLTIIVAVGMADSGDEPEAFLCFCLGTVVLIAASVTFFTPFFKSFLLGTGPVSFGSSAWTTVFTTFQIVVSFFWYVLCKYIMDDEEE